MKEKRNTVYEIVGVKGCEAITYQSGTIKEICDNELLTEYGFEKHNNINDVLRDMDCFSKYKHYAKEVKESD